MEAIIISIGDELMGGQVVDTNSGWLSKQLGAIGVTVKEHVTVGDDADLIAGHLRRAGELVDVILVNGGLGPTQDDVTRHGLAEVLGEQLQLHKRSLEQIEKFFAQLGREMVATNRIQAMIPPSCEVMDNSRGTAPGMIARIGGSVAFFMPGVPVELKVMFTDSVRPRLVQMAQGHSKGRGVIVCRTLHTVGIGESSIAQVLGDLMSRGRSPRVNTIASAGLCSITINARGADEGLARGMIEPIEEQIREKLGKYVYGSDKETLGAVVGGLLSERGASLAVAESCTGGMLADEIIKVPGASKYFKAGWVTYSNDAKMNHLLVSGESLKSFGAVSEEVARELADNSLRLAGADYALSITGIAGPGGGTAQKPVGLVYIGLADREEVMVVRNIFHGGRSIVRQRAVIGALSLLWKKLIRG